MFATCSWPSLCEQSELQCWRRNRRLCGPVQISAARALPLIFNISILNTLRVGAFFAMHGVENNDGRHFLVGQEFVSHRLCLVGDGLAGGARGRCLFCSRILLRYLFFKIVAVDGAVAQFRAVAIHRVDRDAEDGGDLCAVCDADAQECQEA